MDDFGTSEYGEQDSADSLTLEPVRRGSKPANARAGDIRRLSAVRRNASSLDVLVVDDDADIRRALVGALEAQGYRALSASNGLEALEVLRILPTPPSVILMDLMMPVMNGWEFRAELQRAPLLSRIPVVVVSARENIKEEAAQVSASGYLRKPFLLQDLIDAIGKFCGEPQFRGNEPQAES